METTHKSWVMKLAVLALAFCCALVLAACGQGNSSSNSNSSSSGSSSEPQQGITLTENESGGYDMVFKDAEVGTTETVTLKLDSLKGYCLIGEMESGSASVELLEKSTGNGFTDYLMLDSISTSSIEAGEQELTVTVTENDENQVANGTAQLVLYNSEEEAMAAYKEHTGEE